MGYAGYVSAKLPPPKPTEVEAAIAAIKSLDTLEILQKLVYNAAISPKEDKFRRLRLSNEKINTLIVEVPGGIEALQAMGWVQDEEALEFMSIPAGKYMTMQLVRTIESAKERLKKEVEQAAKDRLRQISRQVHNTPEHAADAASASVRVQA